MTKKEAMALSKMLTEPGIFPEMKKDITRSLLDHYKALLSRPEQPIPTPRRMW